MARGVSEEEKEAEGEVRTEGVSEEEKEAEGETRTERERVRFSFRRSPRRRRVVQPGSAQNRRRP